MAALASLTAAVRYCERGESLAVWAEPVNAITNGGYLVAAAFGWHLLRRTPVSSDDRVRLTVLVAITAAIGVGSAAFHTMPSTATKFADVVPIAAFVSLAFYLALTRVVALSKPTAIIALLAFAAAAAGMIAGAHVAGCGDGGCLNGAPGYLPVLIALGATALAALWRGSRSFEALAGATVTFALSLTARTLDHAVCPLASLTGVSITAHAAWHLGTALTAYLVIRGLIAGLAPRATS